MGCVLQVIPELAAGGAERTTVEVAEALVAAGHRALVATRGGRMTAEIEALGPAAQVIMAPVHTKNPLTLRANANHLARIIRSENVDIVHARSRAPAWSALWAARRTRVAFVTTYHGVYNARSALKRWYNGVMARGDRVIANSHFTAAHVAAEHGVGPERLRVIPRGVDLARFDPAAVGADRVAGMRASWGAAAEDFVALLPARLTRWKGQGVAIEALAALLRDQQGRSERVRLVLLGDAQGRQAYVDELRAAAVRSGLDGRVVFGAHTSDMPAALLASDVVLAPSTEPEAFGRVAAEAQCMGRLVIASDHGGARETVDPAVAGWRVTPGDPRALAAGLFEAVALDVSMRGALEKEALARARKLYSTQALQIATLAVYGECATGF